QILRACRALLRRPGNVLILFPEGTRSRDGAMGAFQPGIGMVVAGTEVPVVPCRIEGAHRAWPKGAWWPRPRKLTVCFGAPLSFAARGRGKEAAFAISAELEAAVRECQ
ncbi:MAG: 1-acyl-sn-glycerol-3-phosphate acyltransferase, partial [Planctomycetes bacterium]|nr:1-acyl-sn-glycerol-3-phosphate acyltransferase [Planctomycetota bacterium]